MGYLILRGASRLDAFSVYPFRAWLLGRRLDSLTDAPADVYKRQDHLLSKEAVEDRRCVLLLSYQGKLTNNISGSDALRGHTRSHPEHDG